MSKYTKLLFLAGILILLASLTLQNCTVFAFHDEPGGFQGITWGTDIRDLRDMALYEDGGDLRLYRRQGDAATIGVASLESCSYTFYWGKFYKVFIEFASPSNAHVIKDKLFQKHGEGLLLPSERFVEAYQWSGSIVDIRYEFNKTSNKGTLTYIYMPIDQEKKANEEKKP